MINYLDVDLPKADVGLYLILEVPPTLDVALMLDEQDWQALGLEWRSVVWLMDESLVFLQQSLALQLQEGV